MYNDPKLIIACILFAIVIIGAAIVLYRLSARDEPDTIINHIVVGSVREPDAIVNGTTPGNTIVVAMVPDYVCSHPGCGCTATKEIVLHLKNKSNADPVVTTPVARLCDDHVYAGNLWKRLFDPNGWPEICQTMLYMGLPEPRQQYSYFHIQPVGTSKKLTPKTKYI